MKKLLFLVLALYSVQLYGDNYALSVGEGDKQRLVNQEKLCAPGTEKFLKKCVTPGSKVLEVGCGLGSVSQILARLVGPNGSVLATDISSEQLGIARTLLERPFDNLTFKQISVYDLEQLQEAFDVIYLRFVIMHLPNPVKALTILKKVLKPDGKLIIEDITGNYTMISKPQTRGMECVQYCDKLQFEIEQSDDCYFEKLPTLLTEHGFSIKRLTRSHPEMRSPEDRSILSLGLLSLKDALINAGKISLEEFERCFNEVKELEKDTSAKIFFYEVGHICCTIGQGVQ